MRGLTPVAHSSPDAGNSSSPYPSQPNEVNFWLPLTVAYESNSLLVESRRGAEDFAPIQCGYGTMFRFHGNGYASTTQTDGVPRWRAAVFR